MRGPLRALWFFPAVWILLASSPLHAVTMHDWSKAIGGRSVKIDASGDVVLVGSLYGTVDFGGGPLTSAGSTDVFIAKFDADGNHLWSKRFGDENDQIGEGVAVDGSGNVVITGWFTGTVDFGGGPLVSTDYDIDVFVAKFDADGNHLWSKRFDSSVYGLEVISTVAVDGSDNVVIAEQFVGTVDFGGVPLTSAGSVDIAVAKFDASGGHLWSKGFGDDNYQIAQSIAADGSGNVVITGYFGGTVDFGGGPRRAGDRTCSSRSSTPAAITSGASASGVNSPATPSRASRSRQIVRATSSSPAISITRWTSGAGH